ncbi:MAG: hypothetical protein ACMXYG_03440 [Candidatus Woesearchaeota archaeon]
MSALLVSTRLPSDDRDSLESTWKTSLQNRNIDELNNQERFVLGVITENTEIMQSIPNDELRQYVDLYNEQVRPRESLDISSFDYID